MQHDPTKTEYEYLKHHRLRPQYEAGLKALMEMDISKQDLISNVRLDTYMQVSNRTLLIKYRLLLTVLA